MWKERIVAVAVVVLVTVLLIGAYLWHRAVTHCEVSAIATGATIACPGVRPILIPAGPQ